MANHQNCQEVFAARHFDIDSKSGKTLDDIFKGSPNQRDSLAKKIANNMGFLVGGGQYVTSIPDAAESLLKREYSVVAAINKDSKFFDGHIGAIFVPEVFLTSASEVVDTEVFQSKCSLALESGLEASLSTLCENGEVKKKKAEDIDSCLKGERCEKQVTVDFFPLFCAWH